MHDFFMIFLGSVLGQLMYPFVKKLFTPVHPPHDFPYGWACPIQGCNFHVSSSHDKELLVIRTEHEQYHRGMRR